MFIVNTLRKNIADTIERTFTSYYMKNQKGNALIKELERDKDLESILLSLQPGEQGMITGAIDKIEQESVYSGFKQGFNLALELMNQKPLFTKESE